MIPTLITQFGGWIAGAAALVLAAIGAWAVARKGGVQATELAQAKATTEKNDAASKATAPVDGMSATDVQLGVHKYDRK